MSKKIDNSQEKLAKAVEEYFSANKTVIEIANEEGIDPMLLLFHVNHRKQEREGMKNGN